MKSFNYSGLIFMNLADLTWPPLRFWPPSNILCTFSDANRQQSIAILDSRTAMWAASVFVQSNERWPPFLGPPSPALWSMAWIGRVPSGTTQKKKKKERRENDSVCMIKKSGPLPQYNCYLTWFWLQTHGVIPLNIPASLSSKIGIAAKWARLD